MHGEHENTGCLASLVRLCSLYLERISGCASSVESQCSETSNSSYKQSLRLMHVLALSGSNIDFPTGPLCC